MTIGNIIEARRKELGLTLESVGKATGVGKSTVKKWETGIISSIGSDKITALAKILQMNPGILIDIPSGNCECGYNPILQNYQYTHTEYHQKYEQAIKKFGFYYPRPFRDDRRGEMDSILSKNPPLDKQIECQTEKLKCYFSESLFAADYDLRHCKFHEYIAMVLNQERMFLAMTDECKAAMIEKYGRKPGIPAGKFYIVPQVENISEKMEKTPRTKEDILEIFEKLSPEQKAELISTVVKMQSANKKGRRLVTVALPRQRRRKPLLPLTNSKNTKPLIVKPKKAKI